MVYSTCRIDFSLIPNRVVTAATHAAWSSSAGDDEAATGGARSDDDEVAGCALAIGRKEANAHWWEAIRRVSPATLLPRTAN